jgi:hypothetical protein
LVHLVSRKGLHCMACPRREVHLSAGQHVYELPAAARGAAVTALCIAFIVWLALVAAVLLVPSFARIVGADLARG